MARKSRKQAVVSMPAPSLYVHVALYIRLSVEDNKKRGCSVENQKLVLNDFLADKPEWKRCGLTYARLLFTTENPWECVQALERYRDGSTWSPSQFTRGLYYRGVE